MKFTSKYTAVPVIALAAGCSLAACGKTQSHTAAEQSAKAKVSAEATSSTAKQAKADAQNLLKEDPPPQGASQLSLEAWSPGPSALACRRQLEAGEAVSSLPSSTVVTCPLASRTGRPR